MRSLKHRELAFLLVGSLAAANPVFAKDGSSSNGSNGSSGILHQAQLARQLCLAVSQEAVQVPLRVQALAQVRHRVLAQDPEPNVVLQLSALRIWLKGLSKKHLAIKVAGKDLSLKSRLLKMA